jgi:hypothetical protein
MTIYIIGYGITGCYLSYRLNKLYPTEKIICIEKNHRYGGRIDTRYLNGYAIDMGAWRYSPSSHQYVQSLVTKYKIETVPIPSADVKPMVDIPNDISLGFVQYLIARGIDPSLYVREYGYNIYRDDISTQLMHYEGTVLPPFNCMKNGYVSLINALMHDMNSNVSIHLGISLSHIDGKKMHMSNGSTISLRQKIYVTIPPNKMAEVYPTPILSSMIGYSALRLYITIDRRLPMKMYITSYPLRKVYILANGLVLIYTDAPDARVVESLIQNSIETVSLWLSTLFGEQVHILEYRYKYWNDGIHFWRPVRERHIGEYPFQYLSGDISPEPGWVNGSLSLVNSLYL